jgi:hypothetical protein
MVDPSLWASTPFNNPTALMDFFGENGLWHRVFADVVFRLNGNTYRTYPLGDGGGKAWLASHQIEHNAMRRAVSLGTAPDMESYDLSDRDSYASFMFVHANEHRILRAAAGVP